MRQFAEYFGPFASRVSRYLREAPNANIAPLNLLRQVHGVGSGISKTIDLRPLFELNMQQVISSILRKPRREPVKSKRDSTSSSVHPENHVDLYASIEKILDSFMPMFELMFLSGNFQQQFMMSHDS
ncbi:hypothetical protein P3T76_007137 [Phytophthora citrophthora]|uniref:Uncharacterized protein n=1 Tax=Phytophthora citrophthora TaxID=4793 RepID=A0AAD9LMD2_9STRA|nr:hypothetical protein P3T76_007137 [Phytophthora citrophthora]